ncbi:hypothetical protein COOONC_18977 [Cooperia oncophora]
MRRKLGIPDDVKSAVALGRAENQYGFPFPRAAQMNRLEYLLSLEKVAQEQADKWAATASALPPALDGPGEWNWMNAALTSTAAVADELSAANMAIRSWWDSRRKIDNSAMMALFGNRNVSNPAPEFVEVRLFGH